MCMKMAPGRLLALLSWQGNPPAHHEVSMMPMVSIHATLLTSLAGPQDGPHTICAQAIPENPACTLETVSRSSI